MIDDDARSPATRRALLTTAAWTVPTAVLAVSAPAMAASPCGSRRTGVVTFTPTGSNYTRASATAGTATVPLRTGDTAVRVTLASTMLSGTGATYTTTTSGTRVNYGVTADGLDLLQGNTGTSSSATFGQRATITFDRPVTNLRFRLTGFTQNGVAGNTFRDAAWVSVNPATQTKNPAAGMTVTGSGTQTSPWQAPNGSTSPEARFVDLVYTGPITSLNIHYYNSAGAATSQQALSIGNMTFSAFGAITC